jgi:hypothetical protein
MNKQPWDASRTQAFENDVNAFLGHILDFREACQWHREHFEEPTGEDREALQRLEDKVVEALELLQSPL